MTGRAWAKGPRPRSAAARATPKRTLWDLTVRHPGLDRELDDVIRKVVGRENVGSDLDLEHDIRSLFFSFRAETYQALEAARQVLYLRGIKVVLVDEEGALGAPGERVSAQAIREAPRTNLAVLLPKENLVARTAADVRVRRTRKRSRS